MPRLASITPSDRLLVGPHQQQNHQNWTNMASKRVYNALRSPKRSVLFTACPEVVVKRAVSSSPTSQVVRSATGGRKNTTWLERNKLREKRKLYAFDWNGVRRTSSTWQGSGRGQPQQSDAKGVLGLLFGVSAVAALATPVVKWVHDQSDDLVIDVDSHEGDAKIEEGLRLSEVVSHDRSAERKWVIRGTSVYDITDFVTCHPGGEVILRACGGSIDPYWKLFTIHDKPEVRQLLESYHIGDIDERDLDEDGKINWSVLEGSSPCIEDPFKDDPERDASLIVQTAKPCNAETPGNLLGDFLTPIRLFFVRNHLWVPTIPAENHKLEIELSDGEEMSYSIEDLKKKFKQHTITVTLQCAGNRRSHMSAASENGKTSGLQWNVGAIGTAEFTGVLLRDILTDSGYDVNKACTPSLNDEDADKHVHFCAPSDTYEQSIPIDTALNPTSDVLLAWEMNGEPMTRDHGGPLRAIVPGNVATRSVKWIGKVRISNEESQSNWHTRDYKSFPPNVRAKDLKPEDWEQAPSMQEMPVQSVITNIIRSRAEDAVAAPTSVSGFAYSGGGRKIVRVDVSADGGKTWKQAILKKDAAKGTKRWAWTLWSIDWDEHMLPKEKKDVEFVVKAVDCAFNCQPMDFDAGWNFRGLMGNAWHRVKLLDAVA